MEASRITWTRARRALLGALLLVALSGFATTAEATWRCGNRLVGVGDSAAKVLARCGDPTYRTFSTEFVTYRPSKFEELTRAVSVETWTYDRSPHEFVRELVFRDGYLDFIGEAGYGER